MRGGGDVITDGVAQSSRSKGFAGYKDTIVSCKPGFRLHTEDMGFTQRVTCNKVQTSTQTVPPGASRDAPASDKPPLADQASPQGMGGFSTPGVATGLGLGLLLIGVIGASDDTTGTPGTNGTTGTR